MSARFRIPITAITVFGTSGLLALSIAVVLYLGLHQAVESTRLLWAEQSRTLIDNLENTLAARLQPVREQAVWAARDIKDLSNPAALDAYFFGLLAATPQVTGIAVIDADGQSRRWMRKSHEAIQEDWSQRPWMAEYLQQSRAARSENWRAPIFEESVDAATLLHDVPLRDSEGRFIGVLAQIVSVRDLSVYLARTHGRDGVTPFVLYDREFVLGHPAIESGDLQQPLRRLDDFDDPVLQRIWSPDEDAPFLSKALRETQANGIFHGDDYYLYLHRDITRYGPAPWTIGVYLNTSLIVSGQIEKLLRALLAGVAVLALAIVAAIVVGRKISGPVRRIASAADAVDAGDLDGIEDLGGSRIREIDDAGNAFNKMVAGLRERRLIRETLGRFVPEKVASSLLSGGGDIPVQQTEATILFCDIEAFTQLTETLGPVKIVDLLNAYFSAMVDILERHGGVVTQFQGDAILATFNVPIANPRHAENALRAGCEMLDEVAANRYEGETIRIRVGINSGAVVAGAIGARGRLNYTVHGDAVNLAARLEALNKEYGSRLLVSESTALQVDDRGLIEAGEVSVRGQSNSVRVYSYERYLARPGNGEKR